MARLLLVRHAQTKLHKADRFWGKTDIELSETGTRQAEQLRDRLARTKIDAVYSSTLLRARETADIIASRHKIKTIALKELCECSFGYAEGLTFQEIAEKFPGLAAELARGEAVSFPGGESLEALDRRVGVFMEKVDLLKTESKIAIIAHGGPLRLLVCRLLGLDIRHWLQLRMDHASLSIVETYPQGNILTLLNDVSHLKS
jgi:broad specificity phosphatase PhoE